jgi:RecA/RadA recombinase
LATYSKICVVDGTPFESARATGKYCSEACKQKAKRGAITPNELPEEDSKNTNVELKSKYDDEPLHPECAVAFEEGSLEVCVACREKLEPEPKAPLHMTADFKQARADQIERMNARFRAKGLPLIVPDDWHDSFLPTGVPQIDALTANLDAKKIGGLPRGKITEIFGYKGSGKSSLIKLIMKAHPDTRVLFFDAEGGLNSPPAGVTVVKGNVIEEIMVAMVDAVQSQEYDLVILDSVASLVTQKEFDGDPEGMAAMARAFGPQVKRLLAHLQPLKDGLPDPAATAAVFINQYRDTTKSFGKTKYTVGGRALEYYSSLRLEFASFISKDKIIKNKQIVGQQINVKVEKTRYGRPGQEFKFPLMWDMLEDYDKWAQKRIQELLEA